MLVNETILATAKDKGLWCVTVVFLWLQQSSHFFVRYFSYDRPKDGWTNTGEFLQTNYSHAAVVAPFNGTLSFF